MRVLHVLAYSYPAGNGSATVRWWSWCSCWPRCSGRAARRAPARRRATCRRCALLGTEVGVVCTFCSVIYRCALTSVVFFMMCNYISGVFQFSMVPQRCGGSGGPPRESWRRLRKSPHRSEDAAAARGPARLRSPRDGILRQFLLTRWPTVTLLPCRLLTYLQDSVRLQAEGNGTLEGTIQEPETVGVQLNGVWHLCDCFAFSVKWVG